MYQATPRQKGWSSFYYCATMKTTPLITRCLFAAIVNLKEVVVSGADLDLHAEQLKTVFNDVEPIYIKLKVENRSDKPQEVLLGDRLLENILVWTEADKSKRRNERLQEGGTYTTRTAKKLGPHDKYDTVLLVNEWLPLGTGKHRMNVIIQGEGGIDTAVEVSVSMRASLKKNRQWNI